MQSAPLPASAYTSEAHWQAELTHVLRKEWHALAHVSELKNTGDYIAKTHLGEPILIVRTAEGEIVAHSNVCRHRSATLLDGRGQVSALQCPYHKWTYGLDGKLLAAPFMDGAPDFDPCKLSLHALRTEIWQGWVFVNLDSDAAPLAPRLKALTDLFAPFNLGAFQKTGEMHFPSPWNWKVLIDNFSESYHHFAVHPNTLQRAWKGHESRPVPHDGDFIELRHTIDPEFGTFTVYCIFPTMLIAIGEPDMRITWYNLTINAKDFFDLNVSVLVPPESVDDTEGNAGLLSRLDVIHREDILACDRVQAGLQSAFARTGPLSPLEQPIAAFHNYIRRRIEAGQAAA